MSENRVYHGLHEKQTDGQHEWSVPRIFVEEPKNGPTQRMVDDLVLYELDASGGIDPNWGYAGSGAVRTASLVLADALGYVSPEQAGMRAGAEDRDRTLTALRDAFFRDFIVHIGAEWRLSRGGILRWARGWYSQNQITDVPAAVSDLPVGPALPV